MEPDLDRTLKALAPLSKMSAEHLPGLRHWYKWGPRQMIAMGESTRNGSGHVILVLSPAKPCYYRDINLSPYDGRDPPVRPRHPLPDQCAVQPTARGRQSADPLTPLNRRQIQALQDHRQGMTDDPQRKTPTKISEKIEGPDHSDHARPHRAGTHGDEPAYSDKADGRSEWRTLTWREVREQVLDVAAALIELGLQPGQTGAIMASSRIEHVLSDLAILHAGGIPMSIYPTLAPTQVAQVAETAKPAVLFVEGSEQLARWSEGLKVSDPKVIFFKESDGSPTFAELQARGAELRQDPAKQAELQARINAIKPTDSLTVLFTSGTTGPPKGVQLTHENIMFEIESSLDHAGLRDTTGISLSYLPMAHIAERVLGMYVPQTVSGHVHFVSDPTLLVGALGEVRPNRFFGVPRVWEKIRTGLSAMLAADPDEEKKAAVQAAMDIGIEYVESKQTGHTTSPELEAKYQAVHEAVLGPIKSLLGLDRVEWAVSASAPMPLEVARFFAGLGFKIYDVYGMTETTAAVCSGGPSDFKMGTVGRAMDGVEIKLGEDGEILTRSKLNTPGYMGNAEATAALIDEDGWLHTGDIGELDDEGYLKIVDRKKEMIILSSGKNIAPSNIENYLKESPIIGHAMVVGDDRNYRRGPAHPRHRDPQRSGAQSLAWKTPTRRPWLPIRSWRAWSSRPSRPPTRRSHAPSRSRPTRSLPVEWTAESEELTPTLKLKRRVITKAYADQIDRLYQ
ncbi:MAG: AMP-binding protein [Marmoricola sp.]